jgi:hypothetical protein
VGINVPIRTVLVVSLTKFDGRKVRLLSAREFHQVAGRAGRAGFDTAGTVVVQAPEHVIENERMAAKASNDPAKRRKIIKKKPVPGTVTWGEETFDRLVHAQPEPLSSHFRITHSLLLNVVARPGDAFTAVRHLIEDSDEPRARQLHHMRRAISAYRSLLTAGVVERVDPPDADGRTVRLTVDLQRDFALNQPLSTFALAAMELLDKDSPDYALDVVSVIEATLDDPRQVLYAQRNAARGEAVQGMKAEGIEYEERMELLEEVTHPRPLADLLGHAFETYAQGQPWVTEFELSPKSVVRDMVERAATFTEYVRAYDLIRSEGVLLRYLADAYRALRQTVPDEARTEELRDLVEWLGELVRQVDSSLLDEWAQLAAGTDEHGELRPSSVDDGPPPVTRNTRAFRVLVRNELFRRVRMASLRHWNYLGDLDYDAGWDAERWREVLEAYFAEHDEIGTGPGRPRSGPVPGDRRARAVAGAPGLRRPGRAPGLGHQRRGRPGRVRRGRRGGRPGRRRRTAVAGSGPLRPAAAPAPDAPAGARDAGARGRRVAGRAVQPARSRRRHRGAGGRAHQRHGTDGGRARHRRPGAPAPRGPPALGYVAIVLGRSSLEEPELAYELLPAARGHGYATEGSRALLEATFATGRQRVRATVRPHNTASLRVLDRLGFVRERVTTGRGRRGGVVGPRASRLRRTTARGPHACCAGTYGRVGLSRKGRTPPAARG